MTPILSNASKPGTWRRAWRMRRRRFRLVIGVLTFMCSCSGLTALSTSTAIASSHVKATQQLVVLHYHHDAYRFPRTTAATVASVPAAPAHHRRANHTSRSWADPQSPRDPVAEGDAPRATQQLNRLDPAGGDWWGHHPLAHRREHLSPARPGLLQRPGGKKLSRRGRQVIHTHPDRHILRRRDRDDAAEHARGPICPRAQRPLERFSRV